MMIFLSKDGKWSWELLSFPININKTHVISLYFTIHYLIVSYCELFVLIKISFISILFIKGIFCRFRFRFAIFFVYECICVCVCGACVWYAHMFVCASVCTCDCVTEARRGCRVSCPITLSLISLRQTDLDVKSEILLSSLPPYHNVTTTGAGSRNYFQLLTWALVI